MSAIAWWGIPLGATLVAILWVAWASRSRASKDVFAAQESYERFRRAMEGDSEGPGPRT